MVDPMLKELLTSPIGIKDGSQELTLIRAVAKGFVDPTKGVIIDPRYNREMNAGEAYNTGLITLRGALKLAALFDVHSSLMTPTKKRDQRRRIRRPGQPQEQALGDDKIKITLKEAMKQGLINSQTQRFRQEETVSTVRRVRKTETSAVGGPGGVSVYRAITGGKNSIEVPADGYNIREAERRGFVDLSSGIVSPPGTDKHLSLEEAFSLGVLNPKSLSIKDSKSGRQLSAQEAVEQKVMDRNGFVEYRGRRLTLQEAIDERIAHLEAEPPATISDANKKVIQFSTGSGPVMSFRPVGQAIIEEHEQAWSFDSSVGQL
uniref:Uncharacterized protein n=1 Tax=Panagrolaimus sp. ES5 TaxID=591445 RepID=A0AC34GBD5_9BILA